MKKLSITADEQFRNGDKVYLKPDYADGDPKEQFTLSNVDGNKGRIDDKQGRGWNINLSQITKKRPR